MNGKIENIDRKRTTTKNIIIFGNYNDYHNIKFNLNDIKILTIMEELDEIVPKMLKEIDEECSNRVLANIVSFIHGKRKKFTGKYKNEERKGFIIDYIIEKHDQAKEEAKIFYKIEEDKTNKHHLRKRRKITKNVNLILIVYNLTFQTDELSIQVF